jgi:hypothetical protein
MSPSVKNIPSELGHQYARLVLRPVLLMLPLPPLIFTIGLFMLVVNAVHSVTDIGSARIVVHRHKSSWRDDGGGGPLTGV